MESKHWVWKWRLQFPPHFTPKPQICLQVGQQVAPPATIFLDLFCFEGEIGVPLFGVTLFARCLRFDRPILVATCAMSGVRKFVFFGLGEFFYFKAATWGCVPGGYIFFLKDRSGNSLRQFSPVNLSGKSLRYLPAVIFCLTTVL